MTTTSRPGESAESGADGGGIGFFRPGQLILIHRSTVIPDYPTALERVLAHLEERLQLQFSAAGEPIALRRGEEAAPTFQMKPLYLRGFEPDAPPIPHDPAGNAAVRAGLAAVASAFRELIGDAGKKLLDAAGLLDAAISPNWLAMPLQPII